MLQLLAVLGVAAHLTGGVTPPSELRREELMTALRSGGYTILVRHARTDRLPGLKESPSYTPVERSEQRNLSEQGVRDVRLMGQVFRRFAVPVGEVLSSPLYRTRETAEAFGTPALTMVLRTFPITAETAALVAAAPPAGSNRVLVTHHFVIELTVPGIHPGDIAESEAAVVRPTGDGKVTLVGRITLADWEALAGAPAASHAAPSTLSSPSVFPATRPGRLAARYIEAFNSGDTTRMRAFLEASFVTAPDRPMEARLASYTRLFDDQGPLTLTAVESSDEDAVSLEVRSKKASITLRVVAAAAPADRLQSVTFSIQGAGHP